ncbi:MAG: type II secretion system F family protein [Christensenellales bacterium]|jgi:tight adherence protein B
MMPGVILAASAAIFVFSGGVILLNRFVAQRTLVKQRLRALAGWQEQQVRPVKQKKPKRGRIPVSKVFAEELASAGVRMRPEEFLTLWLAAALAPAGVLMLFRAHPITLIAAAALGVLLPPLLVRRAKGKRLRLFERQLGDALLLMGNSLRSGLTFQQAMGNIAREMPDPIAREFARTVREIQLGCDIDAALDGMVKRVRSTDLMLTVSAVQIQRQVGGNLLEILENTSKTIKERIKLKDDIRVMTASGRISSIVVGMLPVAIGGLLMLINPSYIQTFFDTSMGVIMLVVAAGMEITGFLIIKKIATIKY